MHNFKNLLNLNSFNIIAKFNSIKNISKNNNYSKNIIIINVYEKNIILKYIIMNFISSIKRLNKLFLKISI